MSSRVDVFVVEVVFFVGGVLDGFLAVLDDYGGPVSVDW